MNDKYFESFKHGDIVFHNGDIGIPKRYLSQYRRSFLDWQLAKDLYIDWLKENGTFFAKNKLSDINRASGKNYLEPDDIELDVFKTFATNDLIIAGDFMNYEQYLNSEN